MADLFPVDFTSPIGRVRKYIPDLQQLPDPRHPEGPTSFIFSDAEIQSFINDEAGAGVTPQTWHIRRAAAWAMLAIANSENLILKKIVTEDQQTDGPAVSNAMRAIAADFFKRASEEEARGAASFIDVPFNDPFVAPNGFPPFMRGGYGAYGYSISP